MKKRRIERKFIYTHRDIDGVKWRFQGSRPISELADKVMADSEWPMPLALDKIDTRREKRRNAERSRSHKKRAN